METGLSFVTRKDSEGKEMVLEIDVEYPSEDMGDDGKIHIKRAQYVESKLPVPLYEIDKLDMTELYQEVVDITMIFYNC